MLIKLILQGYPWMEHSRLFEFDEMEDKHRRPKVTSLQSTLQSWQQGFQISVEHLSWKFLVFLRTNDWQSSSIHIFEAYLFSYSYIIVMHHRPKWLWKLIFQWEQMGKTCLSSKISQQSSPKEVLSRIDVLPFRHLWQMSV